MHRIGTPAVGDLPHVVGCRRQPRGVSEHGPRTHQGLGRGRRAEHARAHHRADADLAPRQFKIRPRRPRSLPRRTHRGSPMSSYRSRFAVLGGRHRAAARRDRAARAAASTPNACSPRSCPPTSSAPPSAPPHSATTDGASCSTTTTPPSATSSSARAPLFLAIRFTGVCHQARDAANPPIDRPVSVTFAACASGGTWLQGMT